MSNSVTAAESNSWYLASTSWPNSTEEIGSDTLTHLAANMEDHVCRVVLYLEIPNTKIRLWDVLVLVPNLTFLIFLFLGFDKARLKLRATNSPIFLTFYCLVFVNIAISLLRCVVSMVVNSSSLAHSYADIILWVIVRFFLLMTEMSVVIFGLAFGHLDSRSSIRHVLLVTSLFSLAFSICQGSLEVLRHDETFNVSATSGDVMLFGHGGVLFWFISSIAFSLLYSIIMVLPWTPLREKFALPVKRSFYIYASVLMLLNISCSVGGGLLLFDVREGLCVVDFTTGVYFTFFTPLVYRTFLSDFFDVSQPSLQFSYKGQMDEIGDEDNVSLPQQSFSSLKTDSDYIYQTNNFYENTKFNAAVTPVNPLYVASLQSPDSITGYSLDSQIFDVPSTSKS